MIPRDPFEIGDDREVTLLIKERVLLPSDTITREYEKISKLFTRKIAESWKTRNSENKIHVLQQSWTRDGARVVLKFWPNFRLVVLIKVVLIKKACIMGNICLINLGFPVWNRETDLSNT